jgi:hypothetical protein
MKQSSSLAAGAFLAGALLLSSPSIARQDAARPQPPEDIGATPGHLPKTHYIPSRAASSSYPFWVDASMVLNADGSPNTTLLHPATVILIENFRKNAAGKDSVAVGHYFEDQVSPPERTTLEQATRNSRLVLLGTVTERAYGFAGDEPGQLLRVTPDEIMKGQPRNVPAYFVFMPVGTFKIGNLTIRKTDDYYSDPPAIGEQVVLFVPDSWDWQQNQQDPYLELLDPSGIVTIHSKSKVSLPKRLRQDLSAASSSLGADELLARVRAAVAGKEAN